MAVLTLIIAGNMLRRLAGCRCAIVAAEAVVGDAAVIECGRDPGAGAVTIFALVFTLDMFDCLAGSG